MPRTLGRDGRLDERVQGAERIRKVEGLENGTADDANGQRVYRHASRSRGREEADAERKPTAEKDIGIGAY